MRSPGWKTRRNRSAAQGVAKAANLIQSNLIMNHDDGDDDDDDDDGGGDDDDEEEDDYIVKLLCRFS